MAKLVFLWKEHIGIFLKHQIQNSWNNLAWNRQCSGWIWKKTKNMNSIYWILSLTQKSTNSVYWIGILQKNSTNSVYWIGGSKKGQPIQWTEFKMLFLIYQFVLQKGISWIQWTELVYYSWIFFHPEPMIFSNFLGQGTHQDQAPPGLQQNLSSNGPKAACLWRPPISSNGSYRTSAFAASAPLWAHSWLVTIH